jgi:hypothetical protein
MKPKLLRSFVVALLAAPGLVAWDLPSRAQDVAVAPAPAMPRVWDDEAIASIEVPLPQPGFSPVHVRAEYYYRIPVRPIYKSYTVYHPDREPPGYWDRLQQQVPEEVWPDQPPSTEAEWVRAGAIAFNVPLDVDSVITVEEARDRASYTSGSLAGVPLASDGSLPFVRYLVIPDQQGKGKVVVGNLSCAMCHTRVMPDGSIITGAQGNFPLDRVVASITRTRVPVNLQRRFQRSLFAVPWSNPDPLAGLERMSAAQLAEPMEAIPPGVLARHRSSLAYPQSIPDLTGVKDRLYLDKTGLVQKRSIADLMRYMALNQQADNLSQFGPFIPAAADFRTRPGPETQARASDEQLFALASYLYALEPPANPNIPSRDNKADQAVVARGESVFRRELCDRCHEGALFTNNMLMPVEGFEVPEEHRKTFRIMAETIDTDPGLTLRTRRGTGYYKVPSLRGVWYRTMFSHDGSCATLEDWFDPRRIHEDYRPTGFRGYKVERRAVPGHEFGLDLEEGDRKALIAYLKTL